jgi:sugar phosphate isomerase/epimerase
MRVGVLCRSEELRWAHGLGFRSVEIVRFAESPLASAEWRSHADALAAESNELDVRISAVGALYKNPLDPRQSEEAIGIFRRAIEVASHLRIPVVAGFPGAVIETVIHERGGHPVYRPFEDFLPRLVSFWEPLARYAADHGVRIAFEHCPQGAWHLPVQGYNMLARPAMWEKFFDAFPLENVGLEWDASHLICQFIDPVENIRRFGSRIFHVHAKDAKVNRQLLEIYGICHHGVIEHRFVGLGQSDWPEIVHALLRAGYTGDLNIEGWHDPVYRDHDAAPPDDIHLSGSLAGRKLEEAGLMIAKRTLEALAPPEP